MFFSVTCQIRQAQKGPYRREEEDRRSPKETGGRNSRSQQKEGAIPTDGFEQPSHPHSGKK